MKFRVLSLKSVSGSLRQTIVEVQILNAEPAHFMSVVVADHEPLTEATLLQTVEQAVESNRGIQENLAVVLDAYRAGKVFDTEGVEYEEPMDPAALEDCHHRPGCTCVERDVEGCNRCAGKSIAVD